MGSPLSSSSSLGLFAAHVEPHLESLSVLPEINAAVLLDPTDSSIEGLTRAVQIFESMGGPLHTAVLALLADAYQQTGKYEQAIQVLEKLMQVESASSGSIQLALSKALCYHGDFDRALQVTSELLDSPSVQSSAAARGTVLCAQGTIQLLLMTKDDDYQQAQEVIKVLRVAAISLEPNAAAAYNNLGIAQVVSEVTFLDRIRVDAAMSSFHTGLGMTDNELLRGRIYNNMATTLLLEEHEDDDEMLKLASEYSRDALKTYETGATLSETEKRNGLGLALGLVASCYVRADAAVTAEGLFQTAIDTSGVEPMTKIAQREAYRSYSALCAKWDNRQADTERLERKSVEISDTLADAWKDKPAIMSGLVFPTL